MIRLAFAFAAAALATSPAYAQDSYVVERCQQSRWSYENITCQYAWDVQACRAQAPLRYQLCLDRGGQWPSYPNPYLED